MAGWLHDCKLRLNFHSNSCVDTSCQAATDPVTSDCHAADGIGSSDAAVFMDAELTQSLSSIQESANTMDGLISQTDDMNIGDMGEARDDVEVEGLPVANLIAQDSEGSMQCVLGGQQRLVSAVQEDVQAGNKPSDPAGTSRCEQVHQLEPIKNTGKYLHCSKTARSVRFQEKSTKLVHGVYWNVSGKKSCTIHRKRNQRKITTLKLSKCRQDCNVMIGEETLVDINVEVTRWLKRCAPPLTARHIRKLLRTLDMIHTCMVNQPPCSCTCPYKMKGSRRREELVTLTENLRYELQSTLETSQQSDAYGFAEATSSPLEESSGTIQAHMLVMQDDEGKSDYVSPASTQSELSQLEHSHLLRLTSAQVQPATSAQNEQHRAQSAQHEQHHVQPTSAHNEQHYVQPVPNGQLKQLPPPLLSEHQCVDAQLKSAQCDQLQATQPTLTVPTQCVEQNALHLPMKCENAQHALLSSAGGNMVVPQKKKKSVVRKQKLTVQAHVPNSGSCRLAKMKHRDSSITLKHKKRISKSVKSQSVSTDGFMELGIASQSLLQYRKCTEVCSNEEVVYCSVGPHHDNTLERVGMDVGIAELTDRLADAVCLPEGTHKLFSWTASIRAHYIHSYLSGHQTARLEKQTFP